MDVHRRIIVGVVSLAALYANSSYALGLGEVRLDSALSQPFSAVIELHGAEGFTPADINVSLADADAFSQLGIERAYFLTDLRFTPLLMNQRLVVQVESTRPVSEPYLNFLVQLDRPGGLLLREYVVLLDPPLYQPTPVFPAPAHGVTRPEPAAEGMVSQADRSAVEPILPDLQPQSGAEVYETVAGDSLWVIAQATRPDESVSVRRQMLAIRALNPDAFVDGNMNRLRTGQTLILPAANQVGVDESALQATLRRHDPSAEPVAVQQADVSANQPADVSALVSDQARLRIEGPVLPATAENEQMYNRLDEIESRFNMLLGELEARDRQIASLQAELEVLRRAHDAELREQVSATEGGAVALADAPPSAGTRTGSEDEPPVAGAIEQQAPDLAQGSAQPEAAAQPTSSTIGWLAALLALLAVSVSAILLHLRRRQPEVAPPAMSPSIPQPVILPGSRTADPLEGVELYLTYGRFMEARNMLDKAINAEPTRVDLRWRQLGVLAKLGDAPAFAEQASALRALGGDTGRIEELKVRYAHIDNALRSPGRSSLDLDGFEADADWDFIASPGVRSSRPTSAAKADFESNLTDLPEIGELDEEFSNHFERSGNDQRKSN